MCILCTTPKRQRPAVRRRVIADARTAATMVLLLVKMADRRQRARAHWCDKGFECEDRPVLVLHAQHPRPRWVVLKQTIKK